MAEIFEYEDNPEDHKHDEESNWRDWKKGETHPDFTKSEDSSKEEK